MVLAKKQISKEAELRFAAELTRKGWEIFFPYGEDSSIDLLAYKDGEIMRVQVKATKPKNGSLGCKFRSTNNWQIKKYSKKTVDYFGIYDYENKRGYIINIEDVEGMSEIRIRLEDAKNNQKKKIRLAENYLYFS